MGDNKKLYQSLVKLIVANPLIKHPQFIHYLHTLLKYRNMKRTQIYLTEEEQNELDRLSEQRGVSKSSIVREAVDEYLAKHSKEKRKEVLEYVAGIWEGRDDLPDFEKLREEWDRFE
jgi:predicted DNA-binding protein